MKSHARIGTALLLLSLAPSLAATAPVRAGGATYDAGDGYRSGGRWVDLLRRDGEWVLAAPTAAADRKSVV